MAQKIRGFWFHLCGFFVGVFGTLFGSVHNAEAAWAAWDKTVSESKPDEDTSGYPGENREYRVEKAEITNLFDLYDELYVLYYDKLQDTGTIPTDIVLMGSESDGVFKSCRSSEGFIRYYDQCSFCTENGCESEDYTWFTRTVVEYDATGDGVPVDTAFEYIQGNIKYILDNMELDNGNTKLQPIPTGTVDYGNVQTQNGVQYQTTRRFTGERYGVIFPGHAAHSNCINTTRDATNGCRKLLYSEYGLVYQTMFRIIGCSNGGTLTGASAGDTVASLTGVTCPEPASPFVDGKTCAIRGEAYYNATCDTTTTNDTENVATCRTKILDYFPTFPNGFDGYNGSCEGENMTCKTRDGRVDEPFVKTINGAAYCCVRDFGDNYAKDALTSAIFGDLADVCENEQLKSENGVVYSNCKQRKWCTEVNYTTTDSKGDLVLDNYGYTYIAAMRIIGCARSNDYMVGAKAGDMVTSLDGIVCESCTELTNDDDMLQGYTKYSFRRGMCYISYDDTEQHNLYDATGKFYYKDANSDECSCFENNSFQCS